ncbi:efflux transporter outer membrane subunit [Rhizobium sp. C4]|uniref:efflux transporter outer membrane subunit n=1 Tax=Rhizobium sp. C4 TaxID=1349800 RepID=UPI001E382883|nr:efflux transporter outer membrane subunit [Rhizobium sp. C4]MCD2173443.1 efflux transporter outer membrane subunit [Rhizobium sp. C4]
MKPTLYTAAPLAMMLFLSGCMVGPDMQAPETPMPAKFSEGGKTSNGDVTTATWWTAFSDPRLNHLVTEGMSKNLTVLQALEAIEQARQGVTVAGAGSLPSITGSAAENLSKTNGVSATAQRSNTSGTLSASWLLDLFGQYRRAKESANASLDASYASADVARLTVISNVATYYVNARYYQQLLSIARENLKTRRDTLELTKAQLDAGAASRLNVVQAEGLVNSTLSDIPGLETNFRQQVNHLSTLLGVPAPTLLADMQRSGPQPVARDKISAGIPADLIRNRPDIRRSERQLAAAVANIGVAEAKLYPSIQLSGSISPFHIASTPLTGNGASWSFGPTLTLPIFDGGALRANVKSSEAASRAAYLAWQASVLQGIEETENAMVAYNRDRATVSALRASVKNYQEALSLATTNYKNGASSLLDVLDAQRSVSTAQQALAASIRQSALDYIALNVAVGGGYAAGQAKAGE